MTVAVVTLSCAGACARVEAVATGGHAPYTFTWNDGVTGASRQVCPTSTTSYQVEVTDTGTTGELARPSMKAHARVTADVLRCPDGGSSDGGSAACISNPSFEGTVGAVYDDSSSEAPPWVGCTSSDGGDEFTVISKGPNTVGLCLTFPVATDGATYLALDGAPDGAGAVWEPLCEPMHAGRTYHLRIDLEGIANSCGSVPTSLEIVGGSRSCSAGQVLWTSPVPGPTWQTYCATFTPEVETTHLGLTVPLSSVALSSDAGTAQQQVVQELLVDNIVPVAACP